DLYVSTGYELGSLYRHPNFPAQIGLDNHDFLSALTWSDIGPRTATATGVLNDDDCVPNCASGTYHQYRVQVLATDPRQCVVSISQQGVLPQRVPAYVYGTLTIRALEGGPSILAHGPLFSRPC